MGKTALSQLEHNVNIIMALTELLLLGGIPLGGFPHGFLHSPLPVIYGITYVFFSWATMNHWTSTKRRPAAIYFFMDTTLGWKHTLVLYALLAILLLFFGIFCAVEELAKNNERIQAHVAFMIVIMCLTCRFRD